jgi:hypothetical protein
MLVDVSAEAAHSLGILTMVACGGLGGHGNRNGLHIPGAIVPLPNVTCPILDRQVNGVVADTKCALLIAIRGGCQEIYPI